MFCWEILGLASNVDVVPHTTHLEIVVDQSYRNNFLTKQMPPNLLCQILKDLDPHDQKNLLPTSVYKTQSISSEAGSFSVVAHQCIVFKTHLKLLRFQCFLFSFQSPQPHRASHLELLPRFLVELYNPENSL